jgi:flagellar export protein FliJ
MSGLAALIRFAERRTEGALIAWQRLKAQCDEANQKLLLLQQHGMNYRDLMHAGLQHGMSGSSTMAHLNFIGQIEEVVVRQQSEIVNLEEACERQWRELVEARRDQRMYEILSERAATREAEVASLREQTGIDELLQRTANTPGAF